MAKRGREERGTAHFGGEERPTGYRLPAEVQRDLEWLWCEAESEMGIRSNVGAVEEILRTGCHRGHDGGGALPDPMPDGGSRARQRAWRLWAILSRMKGDGTPEEVGMRCTGARHERVLFRVYGPPTRHAPYGRFAPEYAPIVEYTAAAERAVEKWARKLGRAASVREAVELEVRNDERAVARFAAQCDHLLAAAGRAFAKCARDEDAERRRTRAARLDAQANAAPFEKAVEDAA